MAGLQAQPDPTLPKLDAGSGHPFDEDTELVNGGVMRSRLGHLKGLMPVVTWGATTSVLGFGETGQGLSLPHKAPGAILPGG